QPAPQITPQQPARTAAPPAPSPAQAAKTASVRMPPAQEPNFPAARTPPAPSSSSPGNSAAPAAPRLKPVDPPMAPNGEGNRGDATQRQRPAEMSLEEEMNRLLGELSSKK